MKRLNVNFVDDISKRTMRTNAKQVGQSNQVLEPSSESIGTMAFLEGRGFQVSS